MLFVCVCVFVFCLVHLFDSFLSAAKAFLYGLSDANNMIYDFLSVNRIVMDFEMCVHVCRVVHHFHSAIFRMEFIFHLARSFLLAIIFLCSIRFFVFHSLVSIMQWLHNEYAHTFKFRTLLAVHQSFYQALCRRRYRSITRTLPSFPSYALQDFSFGCVYNRCSFIWVDFLSMTASTELSIIFIRNSAKSKWTNQLQGNSRCKCINSSDTIAIKNKFAWPETVNQSVYFLWGVQNQNQNKNHKLKLFTHFIFIHITKQRNPIELPLWTVYSHCFAI